MIPPVQKLLEIMARLRDPEGGCPWDVEQTFTSIIPHTIEEAYEVADAVERGDMHALKEELGDLLLQVVFHAQMAHESGLFCFEDVVSAIADKLVRRHPHVFDTAEIDSVDAQLQAWETQKAEERQAKADAEGRAPSVLDDVAVSLPALTRAVKLQKRAARVGFDWNDPERVFEKLHEEIGELRAEMAGADKRRMEDELGDVLFVCANLARHFDIDPEGALRAGNAKFERRFRGIEQKLAAQGSSPAESSLDDMDALWNAIKAEERKK